MWLHDKSSSLTLGFSKNKKKISSIRGRPIWKKTSLKMFPSIWGIYLSVTALASHMWDLGFGPWHTQVSFLK